MKKKLAKKVTEKNQINMYINRFIEKKKTKHLNKCIYGWHGISAK